MDMMVVVLVLGLTQAKLSGGNVNYNSEGWNESPAILDNNPEFLLALRGGRKKKISPCVTIPLARAHKRERKHFTMRRTGDVFFSFLFPSRLFLHLFFFYLFFSSELHVSRDQAEWSASWGEKEKREEEIVASR